MEDREGPGAEERRPGNHVCLAKGFTVPQQHPTAGSTSSSQDRKGNRERDNTRALLEGEWEWNVGTQALIPTQAS